VNTLASQNPAAQIPLAFDFNISIGDAGPSDAGPAFGLFHRDGQSSVVFAAAAGNDGPRDFCAVPVHRLDNLLPGMLEFLATNGYWTLNGFIPPRHPRAAKGLPDGALHPYRVRTSRNAVALNAAFVDVDGCDAQAGFVALRDAVARGLVPMPTVIVESGRGLWVLFLLRDEDDASRPTPANELTRFSYELTQCALQARLRDVMPGTVDSAVKDVARLTRVPGSVNTKAAVRVRYWLHASRPTYTLRGLAAAVGVRESTLVREISDTFTPWPTRTKATPDVGRDQRTASGRFRAGNTFGARGGRVRWSIPLENFERLRALRRGFRAGHRANAAFALAVLLRRLRRDEEEIVRRVAQLAAECSPPLAIREQTHAIASSRKYQSTSGRQRNAWFAQLLDISREEAEFLPSWPSADGARRRPDQQRRSRQNVVARRATIRAIVRTLGFIPTQATMREQLAASGFETSAWVIANDYRALKFHSGSKRGGRRFPQTPLPLRHGVSFANGRQH
jgi:hypothetical protein